MHSIHSCHPTVATVPNFSRGQGEEVSPRIAIKLCWLCQRLWVQGTRASLPDTVSTRASAVISPITTLHPRLFGSVAMLCTCRSQ